MKDREMDTKIRNGIEIGRVSSVKQDLTGDSLNDQGNRNQSAILRIEATLSCKIKIKQRFEFTESASGELDMQPLLKAVEYCKNPEYKIEFAFIKSIDRVTRAGSAVYGYLKAEFAKAGVTLVDTYGVISSQTINTLSHLNVKYNWSEYSPSWTSELLEAERAKSEVRDILSRMIGAEVRYTRMGYTARRPQMGYKNETVETPHGKRSIRTADPIESVWFIKMFELRIQGNLTDEQIVRIINDMGFKSRRIFVRDKNDQTKVIDYKGEKPLTIKQFHDYIQNPIYAGVNTEKWTDGTPVRLYKGGLVTVDMFNRANKGKVTILEEGDLLKVVKGFIPKWRQQKNTVSSEYPYKQHILCPHCMQTFQASASTGKGGKPRPAYHCSKGHRYYRIKKAEFHDTVESFVQGVEFTKEAQQKLKMKILEAWSTRKESLLSDSALLDERIAQIKGEQRVIIETIKKLTSEVAIKAVEAELDTLEQERLKLICKRGNKEEEEINVNTLTNYLIYYMEHLHELILSGTDPVQNALMFSLLFDTSATYQEIKDGTPELASIFEYIQQKSPSVRPEGFEPPTISLEPMCSIH